MKVLGIFWLEMLLLSGCWQFRIVKLLDIYLEKTLIRKDIHTSVFIAALITVTKTWASQVAPVIENPPACAGDIGDADSIPGSGRSPGGGHGHPLQCSCLENSMDRGAWWPIPSMGSRRVGHDWSNLAQYSTKKNKIMPFVTIWMEIEIIIF